MSALLVVPCYNESNRWNADYWKSVVQPGRVDVLFVNDGSRDGTLQVLEQTAGSVGAFFVDLPRNGGKAEAVRQGLLQGWSHQSDLIGYLDADGAFPAAEVARMVVDAEDRLAGKPLTGPGTLGELTDTSFDAVWSARVLMAGRDIQRHTSRHYLGRVITTLVAPWHGYAIYDTQAGFKIFRVPPAALPHPVVPGHRTPPAVAAPPWHSHADLGGPSHRMAGRGWVQDECQPVSPNTQGPHVDLSRAHLDSPRAPGLG
jgi:glycosyltransferase involved in cell wall biosynthesis